MDNKIVSKVELKQTKRLWNYLDSSEYHLEVAPDTDLG